ncbi:unnamed protein product [Rhizophagus irregularis]|nr:unnamed protein product [Rhizophagus irregularis]
MHRTIAMRWRISAVEFRSVDLFDLLILRLDSSAILTRGNKFVYFLLSLWVWDFWVCQFSLEIKMCPSLVEIEALSMFTVGFRRPDLKSATGSLKNTDCSSGICCMGIRRV